MSGKVILTIALVAYVIHSAVTMPLRCHTPANVAHCHKVQLDLMREFKTVNWNLVRSI